jgi:SAM-dependent methyltransferase
MQKVYYIDINPTYELWEEMWTNRTIEQELDACDLEAPPRELFLKYLKKEDKVIEAGCGFAKWVIYLHKKGYDILGIDNNNYAITKIKEYDGTIKVDIGNILKISYPDNYFDGYISMGVVEHFEEGPQASLKEAYRLLKPGGLIFVSVPTVNVNRKLFWRPMFTIMNSLHVFRVLWPISSYKEILAAMINVITITEKGNSSMMKGLYKHFIEYRYTRKELEGFLSQAGFEILETRPHDLYDSKDHSVGLWMDFFFFRTREWDNFRLNNIGKLVSQMMNAISPWITCSSVLCVAKSTKKII